jgi:ABC-type multidrug transport system fused ATPase/permease subunit
MFFQLGQSAAAMGMSIFLMGAAICCWMLSNMLTFGILANTVENFSQGKINLNFMPDFDDFSLWDDVVHPFFLSLGTYLVSFGLLFIFIAGLVYFTWTTFNGNAPISMEKRIEMAQKEQEERRDKVAAEFKENHPELYTETEEDKELEQLQKDLQFQRKKEIESVAGKTPEEEAQDRQEMISNFKQLGLPAVGVAILLMFWGLFYFPAACLVAGYTRSFWATLNPAIGLETIKLLGWDYLKILVMLFIISAAIYFLTILLGVIFYAFNMPSIGNIPAKAVGSLIGFYFSVVFAVILGFALYKNSEKLKLFRN